LARFRIGPAAAPWLVFALLALWVIGARWVLRSEPLERDIALYAVTGREMLEGRPLYSDLWDHKPPGIHLIFAGATSVVGPGAPAALLVNVLGSLAILGGLMVAGRRIAGRPGAVMSGVLWAVVGGDLGLEANQPNVELAMNACIAWALAASLGEDESRSSKSPWLSGALMGFGLILKPVVAAPLGLLSAVELAEYSRRNSAHAAARNAGKWLAAALLVASPVMVWCVSRAGLEPVWDALVTFNLAYAEGHVITKLAGLLGIGSHLPTRTLVVLGLLAAAGSVGLTRIPAPDRRRLLAVAGGSVIAIAATGRFFAHYYQLLLPSLVVAAAAGLSWAANRKAAWRITAATVLIAISFLELAAYRLGPDEWSRRKYGEVFLDERRLGEFLRTRLEPGELFWVLAPQPGLYLLTDTIPASGVTYDYPLYKRSPIRDTIGERVIADLERQPPEILIVGTRGGGRVVMPWIRGRYRRMERASPVEGYQLWGLKQPSTVDD
jgi:hypothetical protein